MHKIHASESTYLLYLSGASLFCSVPVKLVCSIVLLFYSVDPAYVLTYRNSLRIYEWYCQIM